MKIAYILTTFPCVSETFALREIEALQREGFDITVFAARRPDCSYFSKLKINPICRPCFFSFDSICSIAYCTSKLFSRLIILFLKIIKLIFLSAHETGILIRNIHTICYFTRLIEQNKITHIHSYFLNWPACIGLALSTMTKRPLSISAHARDIFVEGGAVKEKVKHSEFVVCCTGQGLNKIKGSLPEEYHKRLYLSYHGVSLNSEAVYNHAKGQKNDNCIIGAGRLVPKKGFDNLIRAFALVVQHRPRSCLLIIGNGPQYFHLNELIQELGLRERVDLLGWQENSKTISLIKQAGILSAPSIVTEDGDRDGIPNVILEALSVHTTVVASNLPGISEIIHHKETGLLVEPGNVHSLSEALITLQGDDALRKCVSQIAELFRDAKL
jgi:glycosyltransferase involved in cell wall biosynthesis